MNLYAVFQELSNQLIFDYTDLQKTMISAIKVYGSTNAARKKMQSASVMKNDQDKKKMSAPTQNVQDQAQARKTETPAPTNNSRGNEQAAAAE